MDRLAIRTYVSELDPVTVREALLREHYRGGQSFYVVPRIADLPEVEAFLREQVPEVKFVVAHGQMAAGELDERMNAFYDGRFDVLLSTTIIESGLDIPAANTLIVERADMFGLAQLYQIRGRVGRSKLRAYAFFMTEPRKPLTPQAEKRLRVLGALDLARGRVHAGEPGPRHPRRRQPARRGAVGATSARSGSNSTRRCWRRRSPSFAPARSSWPTRANGRRRSISGCRC